ncbi:C-terminal binding protein [Bacillus sp. JJ1562]|uniref:C-terminal binding protein n=1 Tax=Bacillus sp. JJ1562 TaxID=3122960 RepID=UPI0030034051
MTDRKIMITDCDHDNFDAEKAVFSNQGYSFELLQCKTEDDVINQCQGAVAFINQYAPITEKVFASLPDLKFVVRYGVGVDNIDLKAATTYGVQVCNVPDYGTNEVADHALALMLALTRKIPFMNQLVKSGTWDYSKSVPVFRHGVQTVGIIGLGRIGTAFAQKVHALGCRVIVNDISKKEIYPDFVEFVSLEELLKQSDVVSIHCGLDTSRNLISEKELQLMKPTAYLVNVSRGGIIDEDALDLALEEKWIAGAAIDVAKTEPMSAEAKLMRHDNFLITPHMAWYSEEAAVELKRKVAEETVRFLNGEQVHYPVNQLVVGSK